MKKKFFDIHILARFKSRFYHIHQFYQYRSFKHSN